jgi:hypothetical protein
MGKTYKRNSGFKRDRRDKNFKQSRKFKEWEKPSKHAPISIRTEDGVPPIDDNDFNTDPV